MDNYQAAMNYEAIVMALGKSDGYCSSKMEEVAKHCNIDEALPYNLKTYSEIMGIPVLTLEESYRKCRDSFEKAFTNDDISIIDARSPFWKKDITGVRYLYLKGNKELLSTMGISVVGTRTPSSRGVELTKEVVNSLGERNFTVISGLAMGIDGVAHIQALAKEIPTIGVIGTSICDVYPRQHEKLQTLVAKHGLLVSQFAPCRTVQRYFFMQRNLLMSQLSVATLVVEDRDGGGGVQQALYSEAQNKKVFVLKETMDNRTFLWPRKFKDPVIISNASSTGNIARRALQSKKVFEENSEAKKTETNTDKAKNTRVKSHASKADSKEADLKEADSKKTDSKKTDSKDSLQPELF